jgi:hypothetical protein
MAATITSLKSGSAAVGLPLLSRGEQKLRPKRLPVKARRADGEGADQPVIAAATPVQYEMLSTVRYRIEGRSYTGLVVGIAHDEPIRYDIRRVRPAKGQRKSANKAAGRAGDRVSFGVPHGDVVALVSAPPPGPRIVLSDLPPEPPARLPADAPRAGRFGILARFFGSEIPD